MSQNQNASANDSGTLQVADLAAESSGVEAQPTSHLTLPALSSNRKFDADGQCIDEEMNARALAQRAAILSANPADSDPYSDEFTVGEARALFSAQQTAESADESRTIQFREVKSDTTGEMYTISETVIADDSPAIEMSRQLQAQGENLEARPRVTETEQQPSATQPQAAPTSTSTAQTVATSTTPAENAQQRAVTDASNQTSE
jgi:hypothetical protein